MAWMRGLWLGLFGVVAARAQIAQAPVIPMPADRAADSYAIYSMLMPGGGLGDARWPHGLWLVADTTVTKVADGRSCDSIPDGQGMNPHAVMELSPGYERDFAEILEDFDQHCHERIHLTSGPQWVTSVPLRVLSEAQQRELWLAQGRFIPETDSERAAQTEAQKTYAGAPGLAHFTEVYFNRRHTVALVYAEGNCGGLCGRGTWVGLARTDGNWKLLDWKAPVVVF